ncbi:microtubule-associated protein 70-2, partial [Striga asiatica]
NNLEIKKINEEKKAALAAQFAAEATLRRVHSAQKDDEMPPIEAIITPLEAELKLTRTEVAKLQEDNKALDRLTKSKEAALLEAERTVQMALAKASLVDDLQNKNQELGKQIEICQVSEVEKLTQTVRELEEAVLAGGAAANAVCEYQRKVQEINGEMQQLNDKLAIVERAAKAEAQMKFWRKGSKYPNGTNRASSQRRSMSNGRSRRQSQGVLGNFSTPPSNGFLSMKTIISRSPRISSPNHVKILPSSFNGDRELTNGEKVAPERENNDREPSHGKESQNGNGVTKPFQNGNGFVLTDKLKTENEDCVSGLLYDMLQKDVILLRKHVMRKIKA